MWEAGRVLHQLQATMESDKNAIVIVGFQEQNTLGRRIVEDRPHLRVFGVEHTLRAEVVLNGCSAHADQRELVEFFGWEAHSDGFADLVRLVHLRLGCA
jgi:metallo-beta-lactamase family protein